MIGLAGAKPGSHLGGDPTKVFDFAPYPGAPAGDVDLYVKRSVSARSPTICRGAKALCWRRLSGR